MGWERFKFRYIISALIGCTFLFLMIYGMVILLTPSKVDFKEHGFSKSDFSYLFKQEVFEDLERKYSFKNGYGARFASLSLNDTCRFFIIDFENFLSNDYSDLMLSENPVKQVDLKAYTGLETSEGYDFYFKSDVDTVEVMGLFLDKPKNLMVSKSDKYCFLSLSFKRLGLADRDLESQMIIESPSNAIGCNLFIGEVNNKMVYCLFIGKSRRALKMERFMNYLNLPL